MINYLIVIVTFLNRVYVEMQACGSYKGDASTIVLMVIDKAPPSASVGKRRVMPGVCSLAGTPTSICLFPVYAACRYTVGTVVVSLTMLVVSHVAPESTVEIELVVTDRLPRHRQVRVRMAAREGVAW